MKYQRVYIQIFAGNPTVLRQIQNLGRGQWIQVQGCSAQGLPQKDGVFKVKVSTFPVPQENSSADVHFPACKDRCLCDFGALRVDSLRS